MNRPGSLPTMRRGINNRLRAVGDITSSKDPRSACSKCLRIDQKASPRSYTDTGSFRQERRIGCLTNCDKHDINLNVEFRAEHGYRLAASLFIRFTQDHALASHAFHTSFG